MIDFSEVGIFKTRDGKQITYEDLLRDVYENNIETRDSIKTLVTELTSHIKTPSDAMMVMAHVTMMLDTRVKNDDILVKVASILSRMIQKHGNKSNDDWVISDDEKRQLLQEAESLLNRV